MSFLLLLMYTLDITLFLFIGSDDDCVLPQFVRTVQLLEVFLFFHRGKTAFSPKTFIDLSYAYSDLSLGKTVTFQTLFDITHIPISHSNRDCRRYACIYWPYLLRIPSPRS